MSTSVNCIRNDMLASAVSERSMDEFARQEFNKKRKIIIRDVPPVSYADVKNFMGHFAVADISISKRCQQAVVTLKNGFEAESAVSELSHCMLLGVSVRVNLYRNDNLLCVSGMPRDVIINNAQFRSLVETFGPVEKSFLMTSACGQPKGYGFVEFSHNREKSDHARSLMNGLLVGSSVLRCQFVNESLVEFSDLHSCCLLVSDVPSYLQTELYNAFCSIVSPVNFQSVTDNGQDFVSLIVEYETGVDTENACADVQCKYSSIKIEYCVPGESTKCVYDRISTDKLERSMASPTINVCAAVVGLLNNNSSVVNYFKNLLLQLHQNASSRKTNPGASDNYTDMSLLSNPSFQVALLAVLAGHSPLNYNVQRNPCLSEIGEPMMVHAVEIMDKYSNEHTMTLWQSFISGTGQCELIHKASAHTVEPQKTVCSVPGSHPLNGFPCDSQLISRPQTSLITPISNCGASSSSAALIPANSALHVPLHSTGVFSAAPGVHVPCAVLPPPSNSTVSQPRDVSDVSCGINGAQTLRASCPLLPVDVYPKQVSAAAPQHPGTGFVLPATRFHFNQPAGPSNSTMSLLSNSSNSSANLSASNFAIPPHHATSQLTYTEVSRPLCVNLPVSLNVPLPGVSNSLHQPFNERLSKPCSTAVPPVLVSFNPVASDSVRSSAMVPDEPSSAIPHLFPYSSSQLPQVSNFSILKQEIESNGNNMHTAAGTDHHVDQLVLQKVVSAGGCMSRLKKQLGNGGMLKSTKTHDQRLRFHSTNLGGSVTKRKVLRPIFGRGVRDQLQRIVARQSYTSKETTMTTKSVEHFDVGCIGRTDPHADQENRTVGRSEVVVGVDATNVSSSHESAPITPVNGAKQVHFVPSPEPSPENGYIGQHSQGLGGHYADSYLAKRRKIM